MRKLILAAALAAVVAPTAPLLADPPPWAPAHGRRAKEARHWYPDEHYRPSRHAHRLSSSDRIYRGRDGRYYCRRTNGTTGLIVGGVAGALLGDAIAPGGSKTVGAIIGGGAGALLGRAIDRDVKCR
jgi:hypothetical protein